MRISNLIKIYEEKGQIDTELEKLKNLRVKVGSGMNQDMGDDIRDVMTDYYDGLKKAKNLHSYRFNCRAIPFYSTFDPDSGDWAVTVFKAGMSDDVHLNLSIVSDLQGYNERPEISTTCKAEDFNIEVLINTISNFIRELDLVEDKHFIKA
ncbi:hypothetical protein C3I27_04335 [Campylobacter jejuni]|uniref:Uncharacterized protein n=1 Tax=Campylobacter jejuni TaxID=197 RepID=A0A431E9C2_CAMJU|nr:hypothetical protein [Campylobacter jejuni]RTI48657.1 hypothetical protein C3I27_04335 [Campylobacter jejuni]RTJ78026.1 hypothetical protein C3H57_09470 [Campylobacter jejuni]HEG8091985.1 hypothetical protein [Campylobacter jejuni]HEG8098426.1 hypothetical protein [Campylobacter jejuni]HEG8104713.1 hypothetical protein [Campylobacter jejuni]